MPLEINRNYIKNDWMEKLFNFASLPSDAIEVKVIKRPKQKPLKKLKLNENTYYLSEDDESRSI